MRIFKDSWFKRFARKQNITDEMLQKAIKDAENGLIYAEYGGDVIKQRIGRTGQGKRGGYRTIIIYKKGDKSFFVYGFAKNNKDDISEDEKKQFKKHAEFLLTLSDKQIDLLIENNDLVEVEYEQ